MKAEKCNVCPDSIMIIQVWWWRWLVRMRNFRKLDG